MIFNEELFADIKKHADAAKVKEDEIRKLNDTAQEQMKSLQLKTREAITTYNATRLDKIFTDHFQGKHNDTTAYMAEIVVLLAKDGYIVMDYNAIFQQLCLINIGKVETYGIVPNVIDNWRIATVDLYYKTFETQEFGTIGFYGMLKMLYDKPHRVLNMLKIFGDEESGDQWKNVPILKEYKKSYDLARYVKQDNFDTTTFVTIKTAKEKTKEGKFPKSMWMEVLFTANGKLLNSKQINIQESVAINTIKFLEMACPDFKAEEFFEQTIHSKEEMN